MIENRRDMVSQRLVGVRLDFDGFVVAGACEDFLDLLYGLFPGLRFIFCEQWPRQTLRPGRGVQRVYDRGHDEIGRAGVDRVPDSEGLNFQLLGGQRHIKGALLKPNRLSGACY